MDLDTDTVVKPEPAKFADRKSAEALCTRILTTMDQLNAVLERETELVRAGKLIKASDLQPNKTSLAAVYVADMNDARANALALGRLAPDDVAQLHRRHKEFRAMLQINMAVLATAREVSEDIMKSVAQAVGAKETASGYSLSGRKRPTAERTASGIACDRSL